MMTEVAAAEQRGWLTTILRPAGALDPSALGRLSAALCHLAAASDMVIVDLTAADIASPRRLVMSLRAPAAGLDGTGRCLLLVGASPALAAELNRAAVPAVTLAAGTLPGTVAEFRG
jgi:hypothetical protein